MNISDEAVEAAARAICAAASLTRWEYHGPLTHEVYRIHALRALEAAVPHLKAQAWDEGLIAGYARRSITDNPYRSGAGE